MPVGDIFGSSRAYRAIKLLENQTTANGVPTLATAGVSLDAWAPEKAIQRPGFAHRDATIVVHGVASGAGSVTLRLWAFCAAQQVWCPVGKGTAADKGKLNDRTALEETSTDVIAHAEPFLMLGHFDRLYLETAVIANLTDLDAWLVVPRLPDGQG